MAQESTVSHLSLHDVPSKTRSYCQKFNDILPTRYVLAFMCLLGIIALYAMRSNLNIAIVAMIKEPANKINITECENFNDAKANSSATTYEGEFDWDDEIRGIVLGAFYYGYVLTEVPGGLISERFGAKWVYGLGAFSTAIFTLLTPVASRAGFGYLIAVRVIMGFCEGVTKPSMFCLVAKWCPPLERTQMFAMVVKGNSIGTLIASPISGLLLGIALDNGWPFVFYFFGICGCVWFVVWAFIISESPTVHPRISPKERHYIITSLQDSINLDKDKTKKHITPWKAIFTSMPFWAILVGKFGLLWGKNVLLIETPTFLKSALKFSTQQSAYITSLPHLFDFIFGIGTAFIVDYCRRRKYCNTTVARKVCNTLGNFIPAACFIAIANAKCDRTLAVICLILAAAFTGVGENGSAINHVDISPTYAGTLYGITNSISQLSGIGSPYLTGYINKHYFGSFGWGIVFYIAAGIHIVSSIFYAIFASGEEQWWNKPEEQTSPSDNEKQNPQSDNEKKCTVDEQVSCKL